MDPDRSIQVLSSGDLRRTVSRLVGRRPVVRSDRTLDRHPGRRESSLDGSESSRGGEALGVSGRLASIPAISTVEPSPASYSWGTRSPLGPSEGRRKPMECGPRLRSGRFGNRRSSAGIDSSTAARSFVRRRRISLFGGAPTPQGAAEPCGRTCLRPVTRTAGAAPWSARVAFKRVRPRLCRPWDCALGLPEHRCDLRRRQTHDVA